MRRLVRDLVSVALVALAPACIALVFPGEALGFRARPVARRAPSVAFVRLSAAQELAAMRVARTSWQGENASVRRLVADMSYMELPEPAMTSVLSVGERRRHASLPTMRRGECPFLPSRRAAPPAKLKAEGSADEPPAFPREELLKLD